MIDLQDRTVCPTLEEIGAYVGNPLFQNFCSGSLSDYQCKEKIEYSSCSWERGWNVKFRKSGKTLCTVYPQESFFTVLVVVGTKEKEAVSAILPDCSASLREIYAQTKEGNGQKWLMIDLEDPDRLYDDVLRLIRIRSAKDPHRTTKKKPETPF